VRLGEATKTDKSASSPTKVRLRETLMADLIKAIVKIKSHGCSHAYGRGFGFRSRCGRHFYKADVKKGSLRNFAVNFDMKPENPCR
jgi:hypothetical protein